MKKVLGERDFSILEIANTIKDFETSSMNIFKKTTENDGSDLLLNKKRQGNERRFPTHKSQWIISKIS